MDKDARPLFMCAPRGKNLVLQVTMPSLEKMLMSSSIQQEELQSLRSKVNDPYLSWRKYSCQIHDWACFDGRRFSHFFG